jgi:hypothetical protein
VNAEVVVDAMYAAVLDGIEGRDVVLEVEGTSRW